MHDIMYADKIVAVLREKFRGKKPGKHIVVNVVLSPFTHVTADSLRAAFQALAGKGDFKDVALNIEKSEVSIKCRKCGAVTKISMPVLACPSCQEADFDILDNQEFLIRSIETDEGSQGT